MPHPTACGVAGVASNADLVQGHTGSNVAGGAGARDGAVGACV